MWSLRKQSWIWEKDQNSQVELPWNNDDIPWEESNVEQDGYEGDGDEGESSSNGESNI